VLNAPVGRRTIDFNGKEKENENSFTPLIADAYASGLSTVRESNINSQHGPESGLNSNYH